MNCLKITSTLNNIDLEIIDLKTQKKLPSVPSSVLCLGNFDGVHIGHIALLNEALALKSKLSEKYGNIVCGVCTFREPTQEFLSPTPPPRITSLSEKQKIFADLGMDILITCKFSDVKDMSPENFVSEVLKNKCNCVMAVCGYNYKFGSGGRGNSDTLRSCFDGQVSVVEPITYEGCVVSSTAIRVAVSEGDIHKANAMLGRTFDINTVVKHGRSVGKSLGFATVNQSLQKGCIVPAYGVYISRCTVDGITYPAISNVGVHPTFGENAAAVCETHLFVYSGNAYGKSVTTSLLEFIRPERKFSSAEELTDAVNKDILKAKIYHKL